MNAGGLAALRRQPDAEDLIDAAIELSTTAGYDVAELYGRTLRATRDWAPAGRLADALADLDDVARGWRFAGDRRAWETIREVAVIHSTHGNPELAGRLLGKLRLLPFPVPITIGDSAAQDQNLDQTLAQELGAEAPATLLAQVEGQRVDRAVGPTTNVLGQHRVLGRS